MTCLVPAVSGSGPAGAGTPTQEVVELTARAAIAGVTSDGSGRQDPGGGYLIFSSPRFPILVDSHWVLSWMSLL